MATGSVSLNVTATGVVTAAGVVTISFPAVRLTRTWQGTLSAIDSPPGTVYTVKVGGQSIGVLHAPGPFGPVQIQSGLTLSITAPGLTAATTYQAILLGVDDPADNALPYTGPTANLSSTGIVTPSNALATATDVAILTTSTTVITFTPLVAGNFLVGAYFAVITGTTNVTLAYTWTDARGAQTLTFLNAVAELVAGSPYSVPEFMIASVAGSPITVSMTAGTIAQVLGSASIGQA